MIIEKTNSSFIDVHSHGITSPGSPTLQNLYEEFGNAENPGYYSIGLHPWYFSDSNAEVRWEELVRSMYLPRVMAIGECGLDKLRGASWQVQVNMFRRQIRLANFVAKPIIIHCVKAWSDILQILEEEKVEVPVIFHGFQKNGILANELLEKGYYLSFGKALERSSIQEVFSKLPLERIFLETDDSDIEIHQIYEWASEASGIGINSLALQIKQNAKQVFEPVYQTI
jgi:TatD DNase family protein